MESSIFVLLVKLLVRLIYEQIEDITIVAKGLIEIFYAMGLSKPGASMLVLFFLCFIYSFFLFLAFKFAIQNLKLILILLVLLVIVSSIFLFSFLIL